MGKTYNSLRRKISLNITLPSTLIKTRNRRSPPVRIRLSISDILWDLPPWEVIHIDKLPRPTHRIHSSSLRVKRRAGTTIGSYGRTTRLSFARCESLVELACLEGFGLGDCKKLAYNNSFGLKRKRSRDRAVRRVRCSFIYET
jgi:hypothetical protein